MTPEDEKRIAYNIQKLSETIEKKSVSDLLNFPFKSFAELQESQKTGIISIGTVYHPELLKILGTHADLIMSYVCL